MNSKKILEIKELLEKADKAKTELVKECLRISKILEYQNGSFWTKRHENFIENFYASEEDYISFDDAKKRINVWQRDGGDYSDIEYDLHIDYAYFDMTDEELKIISNDLKELIEKKNKERDKKELKTSIKIKETELKELKEQLNKI